MVIILDIEVLLFNITGRTALNKVNPSSYSGTITILYNALKCAESREQRKVPELSAMAKLVVLCLLINCSIGWSIEGLDLNYKVSLI